MLTPYQIAQERMLNNDNYSQWMGLSLLAIEKGSCVLEMVVRKEMLNGFSIGHGSITYALSDSAFAFASNSHGNHAVSIETSISHIKPIFEADRLTATAIEKSRGKTLGVYEVEVVNQHNIIVALFKGTVFIKNTNWE